jgi:hypothetical protein
MRDRVDRHDERCRADGRADIHGDLRQQRVDCRTMAWLAKAATASRPLCA